MYNAEMIMVRDQPIMLLFLPINRPSCYVAVLLKFTYHAQYYDQEHAEAVVRLLCFYMQFSMSNSLVADYFYKDYFIRVYE